MAAMSSYDTWATREPPWLDEERPVCRCSTCGEFLKAEPDYEREWLDIRLCDGKPSVLSCRYDDGSHEGILAIIGEEFRERTYALAYAPLCGCKEGSHDAAERGEISPETAGEWEHGPHFTVEPYGYGRMLVRVCSKGHVNEEPII